ncbi:hypothetical protein [uncultured Campylobacter sp.]|mgnify:CR=1 FL=1|uniref:hypothetical protein n=1 Tax=uncultured Campylobacter sp. TaxID=218934 RepID=UPI0026279A95|nr:hypothetical protein [uncultured Campylobacter sp.]
MRKPYKNPNSNARFATAGFCAIKFRKRGVKFYEARLRETDFLTRAAELYGTKFHEIKLQTPNSELKMKFSKVKFGGVKFRGGALLKFAAAKGLRRSHSLYAATPFKFIALQNAGFFATKFGEAEFCGAKRRGAGA